MVRYIQVNILLVRSIQVNILLVRSIQVNILLVRSIQVNILLGRYLQVNIPLVRSLQVNILLVRYIQVNILLVRSIQVNILLVRSIQVNILLVISIQVNILLVRYLQVNIPLVRSLQVNILLRIYSEQDVLCGPTPSGIRTHHGYVQQLCIPPQLYAWNSFTTLTYPVIGKMLVVTVCVFTLTVIVVDRFFATLYPRCLVITQAHQVTVIVLIWILGTLLALPWLLYTRYSEYDWIGGHEVLCQAHFPSEDSRKAYVTVSVVIGYVLPVIVMFILLVVTMIKSAPPKVPMTEQRKSFDNMKQKAVTMILTVLVVFFVCWSPPQFERLWDVYRYKGPGAKVGKNNLPMGIHAMTYASFYIAYFSSSIYPLVYIGFNGCFRHAALNFVCRRPNSSALAVLPGEPGPSHSTEDKTSPKLQSLAEDDCFTDMSTS
ncbi:G-protein coupled receptor 54 [Mizuhopecten yessoensis]|uniref:G-protein coupled receptor 54 n=1 Tax=Mizuhopecten yessoensis TaxID=6573 RepID=A0A210QI91_MIZYE|nr:G-protein coupled receptor 54 [Mizuhopecten yessoensis]